MGCTIRPLTTLPELADAVALQRSYWGDDPEAIVPGHMLFTLVQHGGHVLAAQERAGGRLVGILIGLPGIGPAGAGAYLVSKRMVVLPAWRKRGLALRLKRAQRERALSQGIRLIRWTFDPLLAPNARLNLHRLGAQATCLREDYFGAAGPGGQARAGSPDRLAVHWRLDEQRVCALAADAAGGADLASLLAAGATLMHQAGGDVRGLPVPGALRATGGATQLLLEIPEDFPALARADEALAQAWRVHMRAALRALFAAGHVLQDCVRGALDGRERVCYVSRLADGEQRV